MLGSRYVPPTIQCAEGPKYTVLAVLFVADSTVLAVLAVLFVADSTGALESGGYCQRDPGAFAVSPVDATTMNPSLKMMFDSKKNVPYRKPDFAVLRRR